MRSKLLETLTLAGEAIEEGLATFNIPTTAKIAEALAAIREQKAELEKQEPVAQKCYGAGAAWPEQDVMRKVAYELSKWLSAALDDPNVCKEYKKAINDWYSAAMPFPLIKTGKLHRNFLLQVLGGLLAGEYSLEAHSLDMYPSRNDDLQQIYDAIAVVKKELYAVPVRTKDLTKPEMLTRAVAAGFMLHTGYGQSVNKMMPVSDSATLVEFARAVIAADREKNK